MPKKEINSVYKDNKNLHTKRRKRKKKKMRKKIILRCILFLFALFVLCRAIFFIGDFIFYPKTPLVILDAGHGGSDPGCIIGEYNEKDITLQITYLIQNKLEENGVKTYLTRKDDTYISLSDRVSKAQKARGTLFVSIHCNSYQTDTSISGFECYYYFDRDKQLSEKIMQAVQYLGLQIRNAKYGNYYVLRENSMPSVLVETGYMTNPLELQQLNTPEYQQQLAGAIAQGIMDTINAN